MVFGVLIFRYTIMCTLLYMLFDGRLALVYRYRELLGEIAFLAGNCFISDLRYDFRLAYVKLAVASVRVEDYSLEEWSIAARYIAGSDRVFTSCEEAKSFILGL